ncbi:thioredoxin family protein [Pantanalinema rosaneae CENA516]|uniref:thioredoxin family protein n=1 Tax=Pantanalinema rosaneae TaxID=1620701 RepID=UPI003D6F530E
MSGIKVEVLGSGCQKCQQLERNVRAAIAALQLEAEIVHIKDPIEIAQRGVMSTPALAINGNVRSKGKVISTEEIQLLLQA